VLWYLKVTEWYKRSRNVLYHLDTMSDFTVKVFFDTREHTPNCGKKYLLGSWNFKTRDGVIPLLKDICSGLKVRIENVFVRIQHDGNTFQTLMSNSNTKFGELFVDIPENSISLETIYGSFYHQKVEFVNEYTGDVITAGKKTIYGVREDFLECLFVWFAKQLDKPRILFVFKDRESVINGKTTTTEYIRIRQNVLYTGTVRITVSVPIEVVLRVHNLPVFSMTRQDRGRRSVSRPGFTSRPRALSFLR
jgi:hypothetical protein